MKNGLIIFIVSSIAFGFLGYNVQYNKRLKKEIVILQDSLCVLYKNLKPKIVTIVDTIPTRYFFVAYEVMSTTGLQFHGNCSWDTYDGNIPKQSEIIIHIRQFLKKNRHISFIDNNFIIQGLYEFKILQELETFYK